MVRSHVVGLLRWHAQSHADPLHCCRNGWRCERHSGLLGGFILSLAKCSWGELERGILWL